MDLVNDKKVSRLVSILLHLYTEQPETIADIMNAQANGNVQTIIEDLTDVRDALTEGINYLTELKYNN